VPCEERVAVNRTGRVPYEERVAVNRTGRVPYEERVAVNNVRRLAVIFKYDFINVVYSCVLMIYLIIFGCFFCKYKALSYCCT